MYSDELWKLYTITMDFLFLFNNLFINKTKQYYISSDIT